MRAIYLEAETAFLRWVEVPGDGPALVWIHGIWCSSTGELIAAAVQPPLRGRRSLLVDLLGYGYSDRPTDFPYTVEAHARTIVTLLDSLGLDRCVLFGHSMGGTIATHVAAARPGVVRALVLAESTIEAGGGFISGPIAGRDEGEFVAGGFQSMLAEQRRQAVDSGGIQAAHLGITSLVSGVALHHAAVSLSRDTDPPTRAVLAGLPMPRYYLNGELSTASALQPQEDLIAAGVEWRTVPATGHPMALQNPLGLAEILADIVARSERAPHGDGGR